MSDFAFKKADEKIKSASKIESIQNMTNPKKGAEYRVKVSRCKKPKLYGEY
jgi:hypothetical protein